MTPDVMVVLDIVPPRDTSYRMWEVDKAPDLVMEMSSRATHRQDQFHKHALYAEPGIREYWLYDPHGGYLEPCLQGWWLEADIYRPVAGKLRPELGAETFPSEVLRTNWGRLLVTDTLRLWDEERNDWFLPPAESEADRLHQTRRAEREARRADRESPARGAGGTGPRGIGAGSGQAAGTAERKLGTGRILTDPFWDRVLPPLTLPNHGRSSAAAMTQSMACTASQPIQAAGPVTANPAPVSTSRMRRAGPCACSCSSWKPCGQCEPTPIKHAVSD